MVRAITPTAQTALEKQYGNETRPIVRIDWGGAVGTEYYGPVQETIGALTIRRALGNATDVSSILKEASVGNVVSVEVALNDLDDSDTLKSKMDQTLMIGLPATIYSYQEGTGESDLITLLKGTVTTPVSWDEGNRLLTFTVLSSIRSENVGFAPDRNDISNLYEESINVPWPLCFGSVVHVPCVRVFRSPVGKTKSTVAEPSTSVTIDGGDKFPQGSEITIEINGILFIGQFSGEVFSITTANAPKYTGISVSNRILADPDEGDSRFLWILIADSDKTFVGYWLEFEKSGSKRYGYCEVQEGTKLRCRFLPKDDTDPFDDKIDQTWIISEASVMLRDSWSFDNSITWEFGPPNSSGFPAWDYRLDLGLRWYINSGAKVTQLGVSDRYVANLLPSDSVKAVFGRKRNDQGTFLAEIPSTWYTANLSDPLGGQNPTTIVFPEPLEERKQGWTGEVFAVLKSTQGSDTANDVIKYIIDNYTNLSVDTTSFSSVSAAIGTKFPSHFYYSDNGDAITLIQDIAWQARCGLRIFGSNVSIKYLSVEPASDATITESEIDTKSMNLGFTELEDVYTRITAEWKTDGAQEDPALYIAETNIQALGLRELERNMFIYHSEALVKKSIDFWSTRLGNIWRMVKVNTYVELLKLEIFDTLTYGLTDTTLLGSGSIKSVVGDSAYNQDSGLITIESELPSKAGTTSVDSSYWISDAGDPTPGDPVDNFSAPDQDLQTLPEIFNSSSQVDRSGSAATGDEGGTGDINVGPTEPSNITDDTDTVVASELITFNSGLVALKMGAQYQDDVTGDSDRLDNIIGVQNANIGLLLNGKAHENGNTVDLDSGLQINNISGNRLSMPLTGMGVWDSAAGAGGLLGDLLDVVGGFLDLKQQGGYTDGTADIQLSEALIIQTIDIARICLNAARLGVFDSTSGRSVFLDDGFVVESINGTDRLCLRLDTIGVFDNGLNKGALLSDILAIANDGSGDVLALPHDVNFVDALNQTGPIAVRFDNPDAVFRAVEAFAEDA